MSRLLCRSRMLLLCAVLACSPGSAATLGSAGQPLDVAAWLEGHWEGEGLGGWNETFWSAPVNGSMFGAFRHVRGDSVIFYEILTIRPVRGTLVLSLKHFHPDLTGWEERTDALRLPLLRAEKDALHFERMVYRRVSEDIREVTVMLGPDQDNLKPEVFRYRRVRR